MIATRYRRLMERSPELEGTYVGPRTPTEEVLASIWRDVLKLEQVGVHDNFFELGGHSLLATQVVARLAKLLKVDLSLRRFFETATVSALAAELQKKLALARQESPRRLCRCPDGQAAAVVCPAAAVVS